MSQRLSRPLDGLKPAYDVVIVGSGYGGGVAASRLSRAGQRVCVIERGKEFLTGSFPARLPEIRRELQLNGGKMRSGSRTGLFDFRLGSDIHVLVGCGLGGGSLINAGVALEPADRGLGLRAEDAVLAAGVEAESVQAALQLGDVVTAEHRPAEIEEAVTQPVRTLDQRAPRLGTADAVDA